MTKISIDIDTQQAAEAQEILGTETLSSTVEAAFGRIIAEHARQRFVTMGRRGVFADLIDPAFVGKMWS